MKKLYVSFLTMFVSLCMAFTPAFAANYNTSKLTSAINKLVSYYKDQTTLNSADDVIAVASLKLDVKDYQLSSTFTSSLKKIDTKNPGSIGKQIIALNLLGENPKKYNGKNYVTSLEKLVNKDGSVKGSVGSSNDAHVLFGLEAASSSKVKTVAKALAADQAKDGSYGYTSDGQYHSDLDTTAWVIRALYFANSKTYASTIKKAYKFIESKYEADTGCYSGDAGGNTDTQANVIESYFVTDSNTLLKGSKENNPIDYLLTFQKSDGSFTGYDSAYATAEAARCLGTYKNKSIFAPSKATYTITYNNKYAYTGKNIKPSITVKYGTKTLTKKNYKVTYPKTSKKIGSYSFTVKGKGSYKKLSMKKTYTIVPAIPTFSLHAKSHALDVKIKTSKGLSYQIQYNVKGETKTSTVKTNKATTTLKSLKTNVVYSIKVRAYKKVGKKTYYSYYSQARNLMAR